MLEDFATYSLGAEPTGDNDEWRADCIACGKEGHMYINISTGLGCCFSCGYGFNLVKLLQDLEGLSWPDATIKSAMLLRGLIGHRNKRTLSDLRKLLERARDVLMPTETKTELQLPRHSVSISDPLAVVARYYLEGRGFKAAHYTAAGLLYVTHRAQEQPRYFRHLVFPEYSMGGNLLEFWTTRATYTPPEGMPKSYNPAGVARSGVLYGWSRLVGDLNWCIVVEGPLDALAVNGFGVASLGRTLSEQQARQLVERFDRVVVAYDADAIGQTATREACQVLRRAGCRDVRGSLCEYADPGEYAIHGYEPLTVARMLLEKSKKRLGFVQ